MPAAPLLEQPAIRRAAVPLTVAAYHALGAAGLIGENVELLSGVIVEKISKSPLHSVVTEELVAISRQALGDREFYVRQEQPLTLADSEPEPDVAVVRGTRRDYLAGHPTTAELVVEVAASSLEVDRQKVALYAAAGVRECWIVLPELRRVEVSTEPLGGDYARRRIFTAPEILETATLPGCRLELARLFPA